jgi:hypothetical protein
VRRLVASTLILLASLAQAATYEVGPGKAHTTIGSVPWEYAWSLVIGPLPPGLALSSGGVLSGKPTTAGTFVFSVQVRDAGNPAATAQRTLSLRVR